MLSNDFEQIVSQYYEALYRFALSLTRREDDARDLTQQTFYIWAAKGHQLRDHSKVKTWLFTTLHREFLKGRRRQLKFPQEPLEDLTEQLPDTSPEHSGPLDFAPLLSALAKVDDVYQAAVALFYL